MTEGKKLADSVKNLKFELNCMQEKFESISKEKKIEFSSPYEHLAKAYCFLDDIKDLHGEIFGKF